jgi:predicted acetyltransferase
MSIHVKLIPRGKGFMTRALLDTIVQWEQELFRTTDVVHQYVFAKTGFCNVFVYCDDELVSFLTTLKREALFDDQHVLLGGISGVMTPPQHQRKGYAGLALREAKRVIFEEIEADLGALLCVEALVPFYVRYGWQSVTCPVEMAQPGGKVLWPERMMILLRGEEQWHPQKIALCGLPW